MEQSPFLSIIGGSGVYNFPGLIDIQELEVETPFGAPSSPIITGTLSGKKIAFIARHGIGHKYSPTEVNYRANIFALKKIGAKRIISISACGSLREDYAPGDFVIPHQLFDFTKERKKTFFGDGAVAHIGTADPFCENLRKDVISAVQNISIDVHESGTYIAIEGPRFSTKAESSLFRQWGMSIIGMTACPEAFLAKEAGICYATIAHITDYDVWRMSEKPVTVEIVIATAGRNIAHAQKAILNLIDLLPPNSLCECKDSLKDALLTDMDFIENDKKKMIDELKK